MWMKIPLRFFRFAMRHKFDRLLAIAFLHLHARKLLFVGTIRFGILEK